MSTLLEFLSNEITTKFYLPPNSIVSGYYVYAVNYQLEGDVSHPIHRDESDITINICLGISPYFTSFFPFL